MTRAFRRTPIAEGVETVRHGSLLLSMGCELGQGYGIARPMPAQDLLKWMQEFELAEEWKQVRQTNIEDVDISLLVMAVEHHRLVSQVLNAIKSNATLLLPENLEDSDACKFGKWLNSDGHKTYADQEDYQQLVKLHQRVHDLCKLAAHQLVNDETQNLLELSVELKELRNSVLDSLHHLRKA